MPRIVHMPSSQLPLSVAARTASTVISEQKHFILVDDCCDLPIRLTLLQQPFCPYVWRQRPVYIASSDIDTIDFGPLDDDEAANYHEADGLKQHRTEDVPSEVTDDPH